MFPPRFVRLVHFISCPFPLFFDWLIMIINFVLYFFVKSQGIVILQPILLNWDSGQIFLKLKRCWFWRTIVWQSWTSAFSAFIRHFKGILVVNRVSSLILIFFNTLRFYFGSKVLFVTFLYLRTVSNKIETPKVAYRCIINSLRREVRSQFWILRDKR